MSKHRHKHLPKITEKINLVWYLGTNIQVDHKVFPGARPEEQVEVAACQPQRLVAVLWYQDVAVGRNRSPDLEHWTLQRLALGGQMNEDTNDLLVHNRLIQNCKLNVRVVYSVWRIPCVLTRLPVLPTSSILQLWRAWICWRKDAAMLRNQHKTQTDRL